MKRPLTIILLMGVLGMLMLAGMGSFFVGKVGGAEALGGLRRDFAEVYASRLADSASLRMTVCRVGEANGIEVSFRPNAKTLERPRDLEMLLGRMSEMILERRTGPGRAAFVLFRVDMPGGAVLERRFDRP